MQPALVVKIEKKKCWCGINHDSHIGNNIFLKQHCSIQLHLDDSSLKWMFLKEFESNDCVDSVSLALSRKAMVLLT